MSVPPRLVLASALVIVLPGALGACGEGGALADIDVQIVAADGRNPVAAMDGTIAVTVRHAGQRVDCGGDACVTPVSGGAYELALPIASFDGRTEIHVEVETDDERWIGASPTFQPGLEGLDITRALRLVVVPPSACAPLALNGFVTSEAPGLAPARARVAAVQRRNVVLLAGGEGAGGDDHVDRFDQLLFDAQALPTWDRPFDIGPAHGLALSEDVSLVVGARSVQFLRNSFGPPFAREIVLDGASDRSALVSLGAGGAAVIGGAGSSTVHWVGSDGVARGATALTTPRTSPAAALLSGGVLVVGGEDDGAAAEWVRPLEHGVALPLDDALPRARGGVVLPSPDGRSALVIAMERDGTPLADTFVLRGCPEACAVEAGPRWERARADVATTVTAAGVLWLVGGQVDGEPSRLVDRVYWDASQVRIEDGPLLATARSDATAFEHASGVVIVVGGRAQSELLASFEICAPAALDPL